MMRCLKADFDPVHLGMRQLRIIEQRILKTALDFLKTILDSHLSLGVSENKGYAFLGSNKKDPIWGTVLGSPIFWKLPLRNRVRM